MPRTDPPPPNKHGPPSGSPSGRPSQGPRRGSAAPTDEASAQRERDKDVIEDLEITLGEADITLSEDELTDATLSPDWTEPADASEHERVTVAPPMPEAEYVAKMMKELPDAERIPPSRAITPPRGMSKPPMGAESAPPQSRTSRRPSNRPKKPEKQGSIKPRAKTSRAPAPPPQPQAEPLTLDLSDSLLPIAVPSPVPSPVPVPPFERGNVPKFDTLEPAPVTAPSPNTAVKRTLPTFAQGGGGVLDAVATTAPFHSQSSDPPRLSFSPAAGDALELVGVRAQSVKPGPEPKATMVEVKDRFDVGDFTGALALATKILEDEPEHVDAQLYADHCRDTLKQMYVSTLGGLRKIPQLAVSPDQLRWLALDHRAGFLLAQLDGRSTLEELLDVCGMPPFDAMRLLVQLLQQNVIRVV
jgi:hypothetical protein